MDDTDLNKYTKNELLQITKNLAYGLTLEEAVERIVPEEVSRLSVELHSLMCHKRHNQEPGSCSFYIGLSEESKLWLSRASSLATKCKTGDIYNAIACLKHVANEAVSIEQKGGEPAVALLLLLINQYFVDIKPMEW